MKVTAWVWLFVLGLFVSAPTVARADTRFAQTTVQPDTKKAPNAYLKKQQRKQKRQQKQTLAAQKKARKRMKKLHPEMR